MRYWVQSKRKKMGRKEGEGKKEGREGKGEREEEEKKIYL
jgi:hypothetical protein